MAEQAFCPECNRRLAVESPELGDFLTCPHCNTSLEVIYLEPIQLDWLDENSSNSLFDDDEEDDDL